MRLTTDGNAARLEDLHWMQATGENATGAARRLGITEKALEKWCRRHGHHQLINTLTARNPRPIRQDVAA
jgi:transposase-like protein